MSKPLFFHRNYGHNWGILCLGALLLILNALAAEVFAAPPDRAPIPQEVLDKLIPKTQPLPPHAFPNALNRHLEETLTLLDQLSDPNAQPGSISNRWMFLSGKLHAIASLRRDIAGMFSDLRPKLFPRPTNDQLRNWNELQHKVEKRFDEIVGLLDEFLKTRQSAALERLKAELRIVLEKGRGTSINPNFIPTFRQAQPLSRRPDQGNAPPPVYMSSLESGPVMYASLAPIFLMGAAAPPTPSGAASCSYSSADLAENQEVQLTTEIRNLAESLGYSPARIFQYVSNEVKFEPYYGSLKGAVATLQSKAGNATDQASLLIALLRASNIPARYVKGKPRFGINDVRFRRWIGTASNAAAVEILGVGNIQTFLLQTNNITTAYAFTHVWVEACVPYSNYRGTGGDLSGFRWVPLDPSFKDKSYQEGIAVNVDFNYDEFLASRSLDLPHEKYERQIESRIKGKDVDGSGQPISAPPPFFQNNALEDVGYIGTINRRQVDLLPASLPYQVIEFLPWEAGGPSDVAEIPSAHRYSMEITPSDGSKNHDGNNVLSLPSVTLSMPQTLLQRVTLSFKGATQNDQNALDALKSSNSSTVLDGLTAIPCSPIINVVPVIKVDGAEQLLTTNSVNFCTTDNKLTLRITLPELSTLLNGKPVDAINRVTFTNIGAGNNHALFAYGFHTSDRLLTERANKLLTSVKSISDPNTNLEETEGEFLNVVGLKYMRHISDSAKLIGQYDGGSGGNGNHLGLTSSRMKVAYILDQAFAVSREGFVIDFPGGLSSNRDLVTGEPVWKTFLLTGYDFSAFESYIWQENARLDAVSTVRGIQFARETGIEVVVVSGSTNCGGAYTGNWCTEKHKFTDTSSPNFYDQGRINALETYLTNGYTLRIPTRLIEYKALSATPVWKGAVYVAEKNVAGEQLASYIIEGGFAGGFAAGPTVNNSDGGQVGSDYVASDSPVPNLANGDSGVAAGGANSSPAPTFSGDPVNMATGNVYHTERDISIKGRGGLPLVFERSYNSRRGKDGPLGFGWTHSFNHFLTFSDDNANYSVDAADTDSNTSSVIWTDGTGSERFIQVAGGPSGVAIGATFTPPQGFFFTTTRNANGTYSIREKNGLTYTFESVAGTVGQKAKLISIKDRNNNTLTLTYTGGLLSSVTDGLNRSLTFTYNGTRISQICDWTSRCHQYFYDGFGNLGTYKNPRAVAGVQPAVTYEYYSDSGNPNVDHAMKKYTLPRGNSMTFEYYINGKAFRHYNTLGETTTFTFNEFRRETVSVNERGHQRQYFFDKFGNPTKIIEERGGTRIYTYDTNNPMNRISKRDPMGYVTQYAYDTNGNVTTVTNPSGSTVVYSNFNSFNQPGKIKDPRGNYTLLKYDSTGNLLQTIKLKTGVGASIDPATYTPVATDLVAWTINAYDSFGNLLTTKSVRDFSSQVGPTMEFAYDANSLNATTVTRRGDKDGNGSLDSPDSVTLTYDSLGRATTSVRPDFHLAQAVYDPYVDRVAQATDAFGNLRSYTFDSNGNLSTDSLSVIGFNDQVSYTYDMSDRKLTSTNAGGFTSNYQYDPAGNLVQATDPDGRNLTYAYDPNNKVVAAVDQEGRTVSRRLDLDGKPISVTDPNGNAVAYEYYDSTKEGRLKKQTDGVGRATTFDYDANGNVTIVTDNLGRTTLTTYDELNRPTRVVGPVYSDSVLGNVRPVTKNTYDTLGRLTQVAAGRTDSSGTNPGSDVVTTQMTYLYDDFGRKLRETDALGRAWNITYDLNGNPIKVVDAKGQITLMSYKYGHQLQSRIADATGRGLAVVALSSGVKTWTIQTTITDPPPSGFSWLYRGGISVVNGSGGAVGGDAMLESGVGAMIGYIKNSSGTGTVPVYRSTCYSNTSGTCFGYGLSLDVNGSPVAYLATSAPDTPSGNTPFIQSNGVLLQGLTGTASAYLWSATSSVVNTPQADHYYSNDIIVPNGYAAEDTIGFLRQDSGTGAVALKRYFNSASGRHYYSTAADQPSGYSEEATIGYLDTSSGTGLTALYRHYNSSTGDYLLSTSSTPPSGYALQATLGYLQSGASSTNNLVAYIRNPISQVVQAKTQNVVYSYTYDNAHRVTSVNDNRGNKTLSYAYSNGGLLLTMQDNDGNRTDYDYDPTGRLTGIWAPNNDYTAFAYDDAGRLVEKWFPNGVNTQYTYNRDNTLKQLINRHGAGITISEHDYTYDGVGNRISNTELINGTTNPYTYAYDALNRLTTVTNTSTSAVESYAYDPLGNRRTKIAAGTALAYVYDSANQLTEIHTGSIGGTLVGGLVYDNNGNLTKKCENGTVTVNSSTCTGNTVADLTHDPFNRLAQVAKTGISTEIYKYDDQGNRIQKSVGGTISNFLYNGPDVIGQYTSSWGAASAVLTHGPNMDDPIIRATATSTQYFHQDGLGSVVSVTDQTGLTNGTARFDAWGNKIASTGTIPQYGYTGREPDDTGLVYYRARFYDPSIGRFTQRDPIGMNGGMNLYAYATGNPINFNDPTGLKVIDPEEHVQLAAGAGYTGGIGGGLTSAQQTLARFTDPLTDYRGRVLEADDLNMAVATVYAEMTGSDFTRSPYNTFTRPEIVGGTKSAVTTTVTEDGQAIESSAIADVLFNRLDNPGKFAGKIDGRIPSSLGEVVFANGHFTSVNSNLNPRFAEALFGSSVSDPRAYELARAAVVNTANYGPTFNYTSFRGVRQQDQVTKGIFNRTLSNGQWNFGSRTDFWR